MNGEGRKSRLECSQIISGPEYDKGRGRMGRYDNRGFQCDLILPPEKQDSEMAQRDQTTRRFGAWLRPPSTTCVPRLSAIHILWRSIGCQLGPRGSQGRMGWA